jgi:hypothetical protein
MPSPSTLTDRQRFWLERLNACGNRSLKAYAEAHGLNVGLLYDAKSRLKRKGLLSTPPTRFVRVQREAPGASPALWRIHLHNGTLVEVACDPEQWPVLLRGVAELP